ncbi:hypothetical protein KR009_008743 [Drosophila setifemur]|nr:hypothetical protein KR009_008743 [Drosophila setifemur]
MDSRKRRANEGGSGNEGGRGNYNRSRSRYSRSRSRERNRGYGGFRQRNTRSRSRERSQNYRQDHRGGRGGGGGGGGEPDLYQSMIHDDHKDNQRNYNSRNNYEHRPFRREENSDNRNRDRGRAQNNFDNESRRRDDNSRERRSMERSDRFPDREQSRPWNRNYNHDESRGKSSERNVRPRSNLHNNAGNNNTSMRTTSRERERGEDRDRKASSDEDSDEGQMRRNQSRLVTEALNIIIIFGLPKQIIKADIMSELIKLNMEPACIRVIRKQGSDSSRGIAFVEFNTVEEAKQWMDLTQGVITLGDQNLTMQYSHKRIQDWNCNKCGVCNFKFRFNCFVCKTSREEGEVVFSGGSEGIEEVSNILTKKIMLRNLDALTNEERVLTALQEHVPDLAKTVGKVLISRDKLTQASRGICYLIFDTLVDSMNAFNGLTALHPPLKLDDRPVAITYCNDSEERKNLPKDGGATTATTSELGAERGVPGAPSGISESYTLADVPRLAEYSASLYASNPAEHAHYVQYYTDYFTTEISKRSTDHLLTEANSGAAVALSAIQRKNKKMHKIETTITAAAAAAAQAAAEVKASFAVRNVTAPSGNDGKIYPTPDVSKYQYDETSGYYYDPSTGLYYDAHSQYYYNNKMSSYLYWDQRRSTYVLATPASTQAALQEVIAVAEQKEEEAKKTKEKEKDKEGGKHDKVKVAKKIVKDMEKWAKQLNQKKDYTVVATPQPILEGSDVPSTSRGPQGAYADVGFSILEKKERAKLTDYIATTGSPGLNKLDAYGGASESDEESAAPSQNPQSSVGAGGGGGGSDESDFVDLQKLTCLLCKRAFPSLEVLQKHLKMSNLHKENLAKLIPNTEESTGDGYRDRAKERRLKFGESDPPPPLLNRKRFKQSIKARQKVVPDVAPALPISSNNVGSRLMQKMGWSEGQGLGRKNQGRTQIIEAEGHSNNVGLGNQGGKMGPGNDYKSYIKKMMKQRYENA